MDVAEVRELDRRTHPVAEVLGALGAADERPNASMRAIIEAYPASGGLDRDRRRAVLVGPQVERRDVRRPVGRDVDLAASARPTSCCPPGNPALTSADELRGARVCGCCCSGRSSVGR